MPFGDYFELTLLGLDSLIAYSLYKAYKHVSFEANTLERTQVIEVGPELQSSVDRTSNECLPYIGISGITKVSCGAYIESPNVDCIGVLHETSIIEHKSLRSYGFWNEVTRKISSVVRASSFGIAAPFGSGNIPTVFVEVSDPLKADYLIESLPIIFDNFQPSPATLLSRTFDRFFGIFIKGYQFTEKMLPEGVPILGIGKVYLASGVSGKATLFIGPPDDVANKFILTTLTKTEIVHSLRNDAKVIRYSCYAFLITGTALTAYLAYKLFKRNVWLSRPSSIESGVDRDLSVPSPVQNGTSPCSVCLVAQKNILLMPCRHLTVCSVCYESLPVPKKCPVCRTVVKEYLPIYVT